MSAATGMLKPFDDATSADLALRCARDRRTPAADVAVRLDHLWADGCDFVAESQGDDPIALWLERVGSSNPGRLHAVKEAIELAQTRYLASPCPTPSSNGGFRGAPLEHIGLDEGGGGPSDGGNGGFGGEWPGLLPIRADLLPVPPMLPEMLPQAFRDWTTDIARRVSCPLDFVAASLVVVLSSLIGRSVAIRPMQRNGWTVVGNLWGAIVSPPGWLKSPAMAEVMKMVNRLVAQANEDHARDLERHNAEALMRKFQAEVDKDRLKAATKARGRVGDKNGLDEQDMRALAIAVTTFEASKPPGARRYIVNDATIERLAEILVENPRGLLQVRDELMGTLKKFRDPRHEPDRTWFLEAWNGDKRTTTDRIGRGHTNPILCVSVLGTVQPGPIAPYIRDASGNGEGNDGLIARFQVMVYPDAATWRYVDEWPDSEARNRAFEVFRFLDRIEAEPHIVGACEADPFETDGIPYLHFSLEAQEVFKGWYGRLNSVALVSNIDSQVIISHLSKYRSLMPSLALIFHLSEVASGLEPGPVGVRSATMAIEWCTYLEAHARRIYQLAFDSDPEPGRRLLERIHKGDVPSPFTSAWLLKRDWSGLSTKEDVDRALAILERCNVTRSQARQTTERGGRPTEDHFLHPDLPRKAQEEVAG